jgi:DNA uptake protein ComE-like DNA-binding protein
MSRDRSSFLSPGGRERGSVLIIVMWICLGLVALALYFANSMNSEMHAADNRVNEVAARQAVAGGIRYAKYVLSQHAAGGAVPDEDDYKAEALEVGDAKFWFIGRDPEPAGTRAPTEPYFGLVDEASKLNLNTATSAMIQALPLPGMTAEFADTIVAWRSANGQNAANADNTYAQLDPARHNKGALYETVDEVRLVNGAMLDVILGEDTNRNGVLDPNEDDGEQSAPRDDQDGQLLAGLLEYVTVYTSQPATSPTGARRINVTQLNTQQTRQQLRQRLTQVGIPADRANQIIARLPAISNNPNGNNGNAYTSVADFMLSTQMTADEFALIHAELSAATGAASGLVNVNTASAAVLGCLPGIGTDNAATLVAYRQAHPEALTSFAWIAQVLPPANVRQAGRYITDQTYQFSADIAAVGTNGRGYHREKVVFDTTAAKPRIVYRQDLTPFGWALGATARQTLRGTNDI